MSGCGITISSYNIIWQWSGGDILIYRQTDILLTEKKSHDLFVIEMKEIYVHVYTRLLVC